MKELNKNSYLKILEENTDIQKLNIKNVDDPFDFVRHNNILSMDAGGIDTDSTVVSRIARTISSGNLYYYDSNVNVIPFDWLSARERLIYNARVLNNGWTVDWTNMNNIQSDRSYIYANNYDAQTNAFLISETYAVWKQSEDGLIFKTRELARQFIDQNQSDLQIYFSL